MIGLGLFGKIPSCGDFVSAGSVSDNRRAFERWLHMSNDRAAELKRPLPAGPFGFVFRGEDPSTILCGVLRASRDRVGRTFPLALFCEVTVTDSLPCHAVPSALAPQFVQFARLTRAGSEGTEPALVEALGRVVLPPTERLAERARRESERLCNITAAQLLSGIFASPLERSFGFEVLVRACSTLGARSIHRPLVLAARAAADTDLLFWLACAEATCPIGTPCSSFWSPSVQRIFVALGIPDSNVMPLLTEDTPPSDRFWPLWPADIGSLADRPSTLPSEYLERLAHHHKSTGRELIDATKEVADARRHAFDASGPRRD